VTRPAHEQHVAEMSALLRGYRRRWLGVGALLVAGMVGVVTGAAPVTAPGVAATTAAAGALNGALGALLGGERHRWWLVYAGAAFDVALAAALVVWFGPGGWLVVMVLAVLPHAFDHSRRVAVFAVALGALAYSGAGQLHTRAAGVPGSAATVYVDALVFALVALALGALAASLRSRVRRTRGVMAEAEQGFLAVRAEAAEADELGLLERSLNRMLDQIGATISSVQREADEVAAFAEQLAAAAQQLHATSESVTDVARLLAADLGTQRGMADGSRSESAAAAEQAGALQARAERMQADATRLSAAADRGRDRVERASRTLRDIGDEVRGTAASVSGLARLSERIGGFAQTIARIARQTHLLALNAAIEAARAEEHGTGFAVVADEVRKLAAEAARSAREVAEVVGDLRAGIEAAVRAMHAGETKVRDAGAVAGEAEQALDELQQGVRVMGDLVNATAEVSRHQARRLADLAGSLERVASTATASAGRADGAAVATSSQITAMGDLTATSQQLAQLAERLRASIARFSVLRRDQTTAEHRVARRAAD
jgi:methyl-accepting chemotaxis protein